MDIRWEISEEREELELNLTPGKHIIELSGADSAGYLSKKSIVIELEGASQEGESKETNDLANLFKSAWREVMRIKDNYPELFWDASALFLILIVAVVVRRRRHGSSN